MQEHFRREEHLSRVQSELFDLVIIGGGINGVGIARDAVLRGYTVALLEQHDFGFGTSSRSSRLIHGGLRYLEHGEVKLVFESVSERARLAKNARPIVRPLPFIFPSFKGQRSMLTMDIGLWIYDALALFRNYRNHQELNPKAVAELLPGIREQGMLGAVLYYDFQTDDARLVLENALAAIQGGAAVLSYTRVEKITLTPGQGATLIGRNIFDDRRLTIRGRSVICAAGPWTDEVIGMTASPSARWLRPTKGVHIVIPLEKLPVQTALVMRHPTDDRILFVIPYHERVVVGTTDTDYSGDPGIVQTTAEDVQYLLSVLRHFFPKNTLGVDDIIATWAGVRPLLDQQGAQDPGAVSREHRIETREDGLVIIAGGKLTTYRRMAAECVDAAGALVASAGGIARPQHPPTHRLPLPCSEGIARDDDLKTLVDELAPDKLSEKIRTHLVFTYGTCARMFLPLIEEDPSSASVMIEGLPFIWAEVTFAARYEMAYSLADVFIRRTQVFYRALDQGPAAAQQAAQYMARELGWDNGEISNQVKAYEKLVAENRSFK